MLKSLEQQLYILRNLFRGITKMYSNLEASLKANWQARIDKYIPDFNNRKSAR